MLGRLAWRAFSFAYGFLSLLGLILTAELKSRALTSKRNPTREEKKELELAQKDYWQLSGNPIPGFKHKFFELKNGIKLHYVINDGDDGNEGVPKKDVAIFVHGFPDSFLLWKFILCSPRLSSYTMVAVDLPGFGGSDSLPNYGPNEVLETMTSFALGMRELYLKDGGRLVMVTHDWGGIIGVRLAAEAKELADRFVIASAVIPSLVYSNGSSLLASSRRMFKTFLKRPLGNLRLLKTALKTLSPISTQLNRSFYVFVFLLPQPLANMFIRMGNYWFIHLLHHVQAGLQNADGTFSRILSTGEIANYMAMSSGPGISECGDESEYPASVTQRTKDHGASEKIRVYREGLGLGVWEKSLETVISLSEISGQTARSGSGAGLFEDGPPGALKAPTTVIYGRNDPAFERRLGLDGIGDYLTRDSQVLLVEQGGHWLPFEAQGMKVIEDVVEWALGGEQTALKEQFHRTSEVTFVVQK